MIVRTCRRATISLCRNTSFLVNRDSFPAEPGCKRTTTPAVGWSRWRSRTGHAAPTSCAEPRLGHMARIPRRGCPSACSIRSPTRLACSTSCAGRCRACGLASPNQRGDRAYFNRASTPTAKTLNKARYQTATCMLLLRCKKIITLDKRSSRKFDASDAARVRGRGCFGQREEGRYPNDACSVVSPRSSASRRRVSPLCRRSARTLKDLLNS